MKSRSVGFWGLEWSPTVSTGSSLQSLGPRVGVVVNPRGGGGGGGGLVVAVIFGTPV